MSIQRQYQRHGKPAAENPPKARGKRHQTARHIIKRGIRHARRIAKYGRVKYIAGLYPVELHSTKGWRYVPAWS